MRRVADGRIAAADGSSKWITSAEARADGHMLRAECGAVMVGSGTQQADDPQLAQPRPVRSIVQRSLAWLLADRRLIIRYEGRADLLTAFLQLACALLCARKL